MRVLLFLLSVALLSASRFAHAADVTASVGVNAGVMQILSTRRVAPTARATVDLVGVHGFTLGLRDELSVMPPLGEGDRKLSFYNRTTLTTGWAWESFTASVGAGLSQYTMSACSVARCAYVSGLAPTIDLSLAYYDHRLLAGALGVQASATAGWFWGGSSVLRDGVSGVMFTLGPVFRFGQFGGSR